MCIERTMQHEEARALDAFLIVASELERVIGDLHGRNKLACGAAAPRALRHRAHARSPSSRLRAHTGQRRSRLRPARRPLPDGPRQRDGHVRARAPVVAITGANALPIRSSPMTTTPYVPRIMLKESE